MAAITLSGGGTTRAHARSGRRTRSYNPWSPADEARLLQLRADGMRYTQISLILQRSLGSCYARADQVRQRDRSAYRCGKCVTVLPSTDFHTSMKRNGGYCKRCQARPKRTGNPTDAAGWWLTRYLKDHDGLAIRSDVLTDGKTAGHTQAALQRALHDWPTLTHVQRWAGDDPHSRRTISWWMFVDRLDAVRAGDAHALRERKRPLVSKRYWTAEEDATVDRMRSEGATSKQIGMVLVGRTDRAIRLREVHRRRKNRPNG